jgi:hypothetical protein
MMPGDEEWKTPKKWEWKSRQAPVDCGIKGKSCCVWAVTRPGSQDGILPPSEPQDGTRRQDRRPLLESQDQTPSVTEKGSNVVMISPRKKRALTFGDFIVNVYRACGKRKAAGIVRLAVNARLVAFQGHHRFVVS